MLRFALAVTRRGLACALLLGLLAPTRAMANPPAAPKGRQETALPLPLRVSKLLKPGFASKDGHWGMASVSSSPCGADFAIQAVADAVTTGRNAGDLAAE